MATTQVRTKFSGHSGEALAAHLDLPAGPVRSYALYAHCFTCSKDFTSVKTISTQLAALGIAVLRFDFTGLGASGGEFANTNFSSNVQDLLNAADFLRINYEAPTILIGHSLGGAAVLAAAQDIPEAKGVVTIGAPAETKHVTRLFGGLVEDIRENGMAKVSLGGRPFTIKKQFLEDVEGQSLTERIASMRKTLLVMHAPTDETVGIHQAAKIFAAAKHPKSFVSLDGVDHLMSRTEDSAFVARVIGTWAERLLGEDGIIDRSVEDDVIVRETGHGKFRNAVLAGRHHFFADEPQSVGGDDSGPTPYEFLAAALGSCTNMTLRMYAEHKKLDIGKISVRVSHGKVTADHCQDCGDAISGAGGKIDRFEREITVTGSLSPEISKKLVEIANKCPVHKTLEGKAAVVTTVSSDEISGDSATN
ncbi:MAG: bifunctional alpha/beta hydrolase/OsmC family protein [Hyphomicrobiaceae bacterium]